MNDKSRLRILPALLCAMGFAACTSSPPAPAPSAPRAAKAPAADANGTPASAQPLALGALKADSLDRSAGDLDDWFRLDFPDAGTARIVVSGPDGAPLPHLYAAVTDESGQFPGSPVRSGGRPRLELAPQVAKGVRLLWIGSEPEAVGATKYTVRADFTPRAKPAPPKPAPPQTVLYTSRVVEFAQGQGATQLATIAGGTAAGLRPGLRGRLKDGGRVIATFEIVEVFSAGSRVKLDGPLASAVTAQTIVEVDVPK